MIQTKHTYFLVLIIFISAVGIVVTSTQLVQSQETEGDFATSVFLGVQGTLTALTSTVSNSTLATTATATPAGMYIVEDFEYSTMDDLRLNWKVESSGTVDMSIVKDTDGSSLYMTADLPCTGDGSRSMFLTRRFVSAQNFSGYSYIVVKIRTAIPAPAYGGELSVGLWDGSGRREEQWQSTQWFASSDDWIMVGISLTGQITPDVSRDPWQHPADFTIPFWLDGNNPSSAVVNGNLDLNAITTIGIRSNSTNEYCDVAPSAETWIDSIFLL
jgi:hypothetical protein